MNPFWLMEILLNWVETSPWNWVENFHFAIIGQLSIPRQRCWTCRHRKRLGCRLAKNYLQKSWILHGSFKHLRFHHEGLDSIWIRFLVVFFEGKWLVVLVVYKGMKSYPVLWGLWWTIIKIPIKQPGFNGKSLAVLFFLRPKGPWIWRIIPKVPASVASHLHL